MKTCFFCETEVISDYKMLALDKPYTNLFFHKDCVQTIRSYLSGSLYLENYVLMNIDKLEDFVGKPVHNGKQKSKILTKGR